MNADAAAGVAGAVADGGVSLSDGSALLVLGGDCTVELGTVAGASRETPDVGLVYIDYDTDMNTPRASRTARSTGWASPTCSASRTPFRVSPGSARGRRCCARSGPPVRERQLDRLRATDDRRPRHRRGSAGAGSVDPAGSAAASWTAGGGASSASSSTSRGRPGLPRLPIAEETRQYRTMFEQLVAVLRPLVTAPNWTTLTICEVNPTTTRTARRWQGSANRSPPMSCPAPVALSMSEGDSSAAARSWDASYRADRPPWEIDRPQPAVQRLLDAGAFHGDVLDVGCGSGENTMLLASCGVHVLGVDWAAAAVEMARGKARRPTRGPAPDRSTSSTGAPDSRSRASASSSRGAEGRDG